jgi:cell division protease FtsH
MVTVFGMSDKLGHVSFQQEETENQFTKPFSEQTAKVVDEEVYKLVQENYNRILKLVEEKKELVEKLAQRSVVSGCCLPLRSSLFSPLCCFGSLQFVGR